MGRTCGGTNCETNDTIVSMLKLIKLLKDPYYTIGRFITKHCSWCMSDKFFLKVRWLKVVGYKLDLRHPKTFNEKLQVLKLGQYYNNDLITKCADKYRVREYIKEKGFPEILLEL